MRKAFIDASSVVRHTVNISKIGKSRLKNLELAIREVKDKGYEPNPIGDASLWYVFGDLGDLPLEIASELDSVSTPVDHPSPSFEEIVKSLKEPKKETEEKTRKIKRMIKRLVGIDVRTSAITPRHVIVWAKPRHFGRIIGKNGQNVKRLEDAFNLKIIVRESGKRESIRSFKPGNPAFDKIVDKLGESGLELSEDAKVYSWGAREESKRWVILDGDQEFEISKWEDRKQKGKTRLSIHDRRNEEYLELRRMVNHGELRIESSGKQADEYLLGFAEKFPDSIIVSHDKFRDYKGKYPFVRDSERRLDFDILDDEILIIGLEDSEAPTSDEVGEPSATIKKEKITSTTSPLKLHYRSPPKERDKIPSKSEKITSPRSTGRITRDAGTTLICLGLLGLVFLSLTGLLNEASLIGTILVTMIGGVLRLISLVNV